MISYSRNIYIKVAQTFISGLKGQQKIVKTAIKSYGIACTCAWSVVTGQELSGLP